MTDHSRFWRASSSKRQTRRINITHKEEGRLNHMAVINKSADQSKAKKGTVATKAPAAPVGKAAAPASEGKAAPAKVEKEKVERSAPRISAREYAEAGLANAEASLEFAKVHAELHYQSPLAQKKVPNAEERVRGWEEKLAAIDEAENPTPAPAPKAKTKK